MISAGEFRNGLTVEIDGIVYQIIDFQHVKPGKGALLSEQKLKDIKKWRCNRENISPYG